MSEGGKVDVPAMRHRSAWGPALMAAPAGPPGRLGEWRPVVATVTGSFGVVTRCPEHLASWVSVRGSSRKPPVPSGRPRRLA